MLTSRHHGWLDFLPDLFEKVSGDSLLHQAVYAAAYANIAQRYERTDLQYKAIGYYYSALKQVSLLLTKRSVATGDDTITTVMLLGIYEGGNKQSSEESGNLF